MQKLHKTITMLDAATATTNSDAFGISDFKNASIALIGADTAAFTFKIKGSIQKDKPAFGSAKSATNIWDYIDVLDLEDGSSIDGDTGVSFSGNDVRQFEVNTENMQWVGVEVSAYTSGDASAVLSASDNV